MSKSLGNAINPKDLITEFGEDPLRYFLMQTMSFGNDGNFSEELLIEKINNDLANDYGNLINRVIQMIHKYQEGELWNLDPKTPLLPMSKDLLENIQVCTYNVDTDISKLSFNDALKNIRYLISHTNKYIDLTKPWDKAKNEETQQLNEILYIASKSIIVSTLLLSPFMPKSADKVIKTFLNESI